MDLRGFYDQKTPLGDNLGTVKFMATYTQRDSGKWQAKVRRDGYPCVSKSFQTKAEAQAWARSVEREMDTSSFLPSNVAERILFRDIAKRYEQEILPSKKGAKQDSYLLAKVVEAFGNYSLSAITPSLLSEYRDSRLKVLSPQTVKHELGMISRVYQAALLDWKIEIPKGNPIALIRKPSIDNDRDRRLEGNEEALLLDSLRDGCNSIWPHAAAVLAIETAARQGEILSMKWEEVFLDKRTIRLRGVHGGTTKNGDPYRDVPLTKKATELLSDLPRQSKGKVFPITRDALKKSWERAIKRGRQNHVHSILQTMHAEMGFDENFSKREINALVYKKREPSQVTIDLVLQTEREDKTLVDLHFHDLRHEGTSRLASKLAMHELMKVTGHKTTRMFARYYHPRAEELTKKLDN